MSHVAVKLERAISSERCNVVVTGKRFRSNFIEPGVVDYSDVGCGIELLRRETITKGLQSAMGNPLTKGHIPIHLNAFDGIAHGYVDKVGFDSSTGMYFCEGTIESDEARALIRSGYQPSCGYKVTSFGPGGRYNNVPYEREITGIQFHHLAIVAKPRYQEADFRLNSKEKPAMSFKTFWKKLTAAPEAGGAAKSEEVAGELPADASIEIDGQQVRLNDLVDAKKKQDEAEALAARENEVTEETRVEYAPGKFATVGELTALYRTNASKADDDKDEETDEEKTKRENEAKEKAASKRENAVSFKVLRAAAQSAKQPQIQRMNTAGTVEEGVARGKERYGKIAAGKN